jgi:adenylylsulfate kinase-like enzyme
LPFCPIAVLEQLKKYATSIMKYVTTHPTTTTGSGNTKHKFTNATRDMLVTQGSTVVLSDGSAVMVSVGTDLGDTHEDDDETFWYAGGRSVDAVSTVYNHFGHWEQGVVQASFNARLTRRMARKSCLPFTDVFPWFVKHDNDYSAGSKYLRRYMGIVKPIVVLTYGSLVCESLFWLLILLTPH